MQSSSDPFSREFFQGNFTNLRILDTLELEAQIFCSGFCNAEILQINLKMINFTAENSFVSSGKCGGRHHIQRTSWEEIFFHV